MLSLHFVSGTKLHDRIIRAVEHLEDPSARATHVTLVRDGEGIEASWPKVRRWVPYVANRGWSVSVAATPSQEAIIWKTALAHIGDAYDFVGLIQAGFYALSRHPEAWLEDDKARVHCASLVVDCLRVGGLDWFPGIPSSNVTPAMLAKASAKERLRHGGRDTDREQYRKDALLPRPHERRGHLERDYF